MPAFLIPVAAIALAAVALGLMARRAVRTGKALRESGWKLKNETMRADAAEMAATVAESSFSQASRVAEHAVQQVGQANKNATAAWYVAADRLDQLTARIESLAALAEGEPAYEPRGRHVKPPETAELPTSPVSEWTD
jgi:hypothetical protein